MATLTGFGIIANELNYVKKIAKTKKDKIMKKIKKGTKVIVTALTNNHGFEIGEVVIARHDFIFGERCVDFENKNGNCWYLDPDEYEFLDNIYFKLKKEK